MEDKTTNLRKYLRIALVLAVVLSIIPFFILCIYIHPQGDDYLFFNSIAGKNVFETLAYYYTNWGGRFVLYFFDIILAHGFSNIYIYRSLAFILILLLATAFYLLISVLFNGTTTRKNILLASLLLLLTYLYTVPEVCTLFYYVICGYSSLVGSVFFIVLLAISIKQVRATTIKKKGLYTFIACIAALCIGGFYEPVFCMTFVCLAIAWLIMLFKRDSNRNYFLLITLAMIIAIIISILAPGNKVRGGSKLFENGQSNLIPVIIKSGIHACLLVFHSLQNPLLLLSILLFIPLAYRLYNTDTVIRKYLSVNPAIPFLSLFAIASAGSFPCIWSLGSTPERVDNQIMLFLLINWFAFVQTTVTLLAKKDINVLTNKNIVPVAYALIILSLLPLKYNKKIRAAEHDMLVKAPAFNKKWHERVSLIHTLIGEGQKNIVLPPMMDNCNDYPYTIYWASSDITKNPGRIFNKYYARYLGIDSIRVTSSCFDSFDGN